MTKSLLIGLTGGIGSGKSTVAKIIKSLGIPVFNSDLEAKIIINSNDDVIKSIINEFGNVYTSKGLDTKKLAKIVFNDSKALTILNKIVHPEVKLAFDKWVEKHSEEKILVKEAAILFETEAFKELDKTILVIAPQELKIKRVVNRDGVDEIDVRRRMEAQMNDEEKLNLANFIIYNDDQQLLIPQLIEVFSNLKA
jgi:dephospho-CoA kinase